MGMNGQFVMNNNPLTQSLNLEKKVGGISNSLKIKMGKINPENVVRRHLSEKGKPVISLGGIHDIDFNFS